ncbi:MAG: acyl carrier protein [Acidimicrobiales bacterium]|nr:acyl carrier protein [Acidimicrobiales bacterium]
MSTDAPTSEPADYRAVIIESICKVAPDIDTAELEATDQDEVLADSFELDSMDTLNIAAAVYEKTGIDIPEADYHHLETLASFEAYLRSNAPS